MNDGSSKSPHSKTDVEEFLILWKGLNDKERKTLLFNMLEGNLVPKLQQLAISGVDLVDCEEDGTNLLHHASYSDNSEVIKCLVYIGCQVDGKDKMGRTPLHIASEYGNLQTLKILLESSKNWFIKDNSGKSFIKIANKENRFKIYILSILVYIKTKIFKL
jgi:ankyrin repeat protein